MIEDLMATVVMLTPGILASKTYRFLTRQPQAVSQTYKAPEILLFAVVTYGLAEALGRGPVWAHVLGLVIGLVTAQLAFLKQEEWRDRLIWRHIGNRSLIPTWYSSFLAGDGKWWQIERKGKDEPIVCQIVEWPSSPESGYYRIKAVSGGRDHRKGGEYLVPADTIDLLEVRDDPSTDCVGGEGRTQRRNVGGAKHSVGTPNSRGGLRSGLTLAAILGIGWVAERCLSCTHGKSGKQHGSLTRGSVSPPADVHVNSTTEGS